MELTNVMEIASVPAIVTLVYIIMEVLKKAIKNDRFADCIPLLCVVVGAVFGAVSYLCIPGMVPADNIFVAVIIGAASGWAATGADQTIKYLENGSDGDGT